LTAEQDLAAHDAAGRLGDESEQGERGHRLARAGLAHQPQRLALAQAEADPVHRPHHAPARVQVGAEVLHVEQEGAGPARGDHTWRRRGSSQSRSQSPNRLKASTTSMMAAPGTTDSHQAPAMWLRPSATLRPHDGGGGAIPAPRNESEASTMITK